MNKKLTCLALFLLCSLLLVPAAMADSACVQGTLNGTTPNYTNPSGFTCNINNILDFSNFSLAQSPNQNTPTVTVNPIPPDPNGVLLPPGELGFNFTGGWSSGNTQDVNVGFNVTGVGSSEISDVVIFFQNVSATGNEHAFYTEQITDTDPNSTGYGKTITVNLKDPNSNQVYDVGKQFVNTVFGGPVDSISISKDVTFLCGPTGTSTCTEGSGVLMSGFGNAYSYVPEPRGLSLMLGLGLLVGLALFKRRAVAQN